MPRDDTMPGCSDCTSTPLDRPPANARPPATALGINAPRPRTGTNSARRGPTTSSSGKAVEPLKPDFVSGSGLPRRLSW